MSIIHNTNDYNNNQIYHQTVITVKHDRQQCI